MKINAEWHKSHKMPSNPSHSERMEWHIGHAKECTCREMSDLLRAQTEQYLKEKAA